MKRLIIVRHGAFGYDTPGVLDTAHPLNRQGRYEAARAAEQLAALKSTPDLIMTSPACRARETAETFNKELQLAPECLCEETGIYEAEKTEILRIVQRLNDSIDTVMLVGHNPGVSSLLNYLVDSDIGLMSTSSFAVVELDVNRWSQISFKTSKLVHYYAPESNVQSFGWWQRFTLWQRQRMQKVELFVVFLIGLLLILGIIALIVASSTDPAGLPLQGSGRN